MSQSPESSSTTVLRPTPLEVASLGFNLHTHAIGDRANRSFLNVMQEVRDTGHNDVRLTMGHTLVVDDADLPRFQELNVVANS